MTIHTSLSGIAVRSFLAGAALTLGLNAPAQAWTPTHRVVTPKGQVVLRVLPDQAVLFAYAPGGTSAGEIPESPMWDPAATLNFKGGEIQELSVGSSLTVDGASLKVYLDPVTREPALELKQGGEGEGAASLYRFDFSEPSPGGSRSFRLRAPQVDHLYGLGEQLAPELLGKSDGDLIGQVRYAGTNLESEERDPKGVYGNSMVPLAGGAASNAMFPVLHLVDDSGPDAMLFLDNTVLTRWDFRSSPWQVELRRGTISGALAWGKESGELRRTYMDWTGHAPVPPRKAFGLWVSEYGYENWAEVDDLADSLKKAGFPMDGFVLDLQWFGGITESSRNSRMGALTFDLANFPNPAAKIAELARQGLGIIVIEEPYIAGDLPEFADLASKGFMVRSKSQPEQPLEIDETPWWGLGSMLDYTNPKAAAYWHRLKREPLRQMGILGHWTDLGEPEMFRHVVGKSKGKTTYETPLYYGDADQLTANNLFGLRWAESIYQGFGAEGAAKRPLILGRTGTSGIQRFGAALWSGDIGANWASLRSHYRAQGHLAMSGVDYFGSDVGGFYRKAYEESPGGYDELYTRWFAAACLTDIPLRPHTNNLEGKYHTAPHKVGDPASNLANLRQRYRLIPYLYTAAHRAYRDGSMLVAPPVAVSQGQEALDVSGTHKWIGADLLARLILEPNAEQVAVTLPPGRWYDFESGVLVSEGGGATVKAPARQSGLRRTPLFARGGAVIALGSPDSSEPNPGLLELAVFPDKQAWSGQHIEDDGWSQKYRQGSLAETALQQSAWSGRHGTVTVGARVGDLAGTLGECRDLVLRVASSQKSMLAMVDGKDHEMVKEGEFWVLRLPGRSAQAKTVISFR